jgi:ABC-type dipeptide/oligopeptide/nickel transport system permease subunit
MYGLILIQASFLVVGFIYNEAILSILGLGVQPPNPDLGVMLFNGSERLGYNAWEVTFPSIMITILILTFTFFGDGVRDAFDPRGRGN